jgi:hypothetical protein
MLEIRCRVFVSVVDKGIHELDREVVFIHLGKLLQEVDFSCYHSEMNVSVLLINFDDLNGHILVGGDLSGFKDLTEGANPKRF